MVYALRFLSSPNAEHSSGPGTFLRRPSEDGPRPEHSPGLWTLLMLRPPAPYLIGTLPEPLDTPPGPDTPQLLDILPAPDIPWAVQAPSCQ